MPTIARARGTWYLFCLGWASVFWLFPAVALAASPTYEVSADGRPRGQLAAVMDRGVPYFSLHEVAELFGGQAAVASGGKSATLRMARKLFQLTAGRPAVVAEGRSLVLERPPKQIGGVFMVPGEFLSKAMTSVLGRPVSVALVQRAGATVVDLRFRSYPTYTRVVVEGSTSFDYNVAQVGKELQIELPTLAVAGRTQRVDDGVIERLQLEKARDRGALLRVGFAGPLPERKVLVLRDPPRLVLDAGHGGHDPGATGAGGLKEKDVVLDVTKRLARILEAGGGIKVSLSRTGDYFIPLKERTSFANGLRADLFVSIHANAHRVSASEGVETYFLSSEATDNEARAVAAFENGVIALEPNRPKEDILKSILWDMAQSEFQEESSHLAEILQDSLARSLRLQNRGVKQAAFYVLGGAAMPAVLVEVGFVTNPKEERRLSDEGYREQVARAVATGLIDYKRRYDQRMGVLP